VTLVGSHNPLGAKQSLKPHLGEVTYPERLLWTLQFLYAHVSTLILLMLPVTQCGFFLVPHCPLSVIKTAWSDLMSQCFSGILIPSDSVCFLSFTHTRTHLGSFAHIQHQAILVDCCSVPFETTALKMHHFLIYLFGLCSALDANITWLIQSIIPENNWFLPQMSLISSL
jgi:hypothetical protein